MRAPVVILILILLASALVVFPSPARGDTWTPASTRTITPSSTSPGFGFSVTITFTAPSVKSTLYLTEGSVDPTDRGGAWYTPHDYASFKITSWIADPATNLYDGSSAWIWQPEQFGPGQKISLSYSVLVAKGVALGTYPIDGMVGRVVNADPPVEEYHIGGAASVGLIPAKLTVVAGTDKTLYFGGDTVAVTASVTDPSGAPVTGADVTARFIPSGATLTLTEKATGRYEGSLPLAQDATVGTWTMEVTAKDTEGNTGKGAASFQVGFHIMSLSASTDRSAYRAFETVRLSAHLKAPDGSPVSTAKVEATLSPGNAVVDMPEVSAGTYQADYHLNSPTALGAWSAHVEATWGAGTTGVVTASGDVSWTVSRAALILTPTLTAKNVKRLEIVNLAVITTYPDNSPLIQTTVSATVDNKAFQGLTATSDSSGKVSFAWNLGADAPLGDHTITVKVDAPTGSGEASMGFTVLATNLDVSLSIPQTITQGDQVRVGATVRYANGQLATGATAGLTAASLGIQDQPMSYNQSASQYVTSVKFTGTGSVTIVVQVRDAYGNTGQATAQVTVLTQAPPAPGINWAIVGLVVIVAGVVVAVGIALGVSRMRKKSRKGPE